MRCVRVCASVRKRERTVCGGGRAAAASGDLMLMRSVMGVNREREGNRLGLHRQARLSLCTAVCLPIYSPIPMRLCFDLSPANDSTIALPLESYTSAAEHPYMISSFIFFLPYRSPQTHRPEPQSLIQGEGAASH